MGILDIKKIDVPDFFPNTEIVRNDIADYYFEVERFDREVGKIIPHLLQVASWLLILSKCT